MTTDLQRFSDEIAKFDPASFFGLPREYFDSIGDLRYCNNEPLVLQRGGITYWTPFLGWIRYGLNVHKYGVSDNSWLNSDGSNGEWPVAFHGFRRDVTGCVRGIALNGFKVFKGKNSQWGSLSPDIGPNRDFYFNKTCGTGTKIFFVKSFSKI